MNCINNLGLEFLLDKKETHQGLLHSIFSEGQAITGYYLRPYFNAHFGAAQLIAKTNVNEEKKEIHFTGLDTHMSGPCVWKAVIQDVLKNDENEDALSRKLLVCKEDGKGLATINLVNADVLPSFLPGDIITAQMIGFALDIHYHQNEEAYIAKQQKEKDEKVTLLADGAIIPIGLLSKSNPDYIMLRGTVKQAICKSVKLGETEAYPCISTFIDTQYGELEIVHTDEQINEDERKFIKKGALIEGVVVLSGDVAIYEYEKGFVLNEKNNLSLLRYTMQQGDPERLRAVLSEDIEYISDTTQKVYHGIDQVIQSFQTVKDSNPVTLFFAHYATITAIDDGEEELPYKVGQACIIIAMHTEDNFDSICFMKCNQQGKISTIHTTENPRYHFKIQKELTD